MLYFVRSIQGDDLRVVACHSEAQAAREAGETVTTRHDLKDRRAAKLLAEEATVATGKLYIAVDQGRGVWPRHDVIAAPVVGDQVSYTFNGDYYPCGEIVRVSETLRCVTTSEGKVFYRRGLSAAWIYGGTWSMVQGHIDRRNPHI